MDNQKSKFLALSIVGLMLAFGTFGFPPVTFAQSDYGYVDMSSGGTGDYGSSDTSCCSDYGYTDMSPSYSDYGYTDLSPNTSDYGYTDLSPNTSDYGYADLSPNTSDYGYTDLSPNDYGYADLSPNTYSSATPDYAYTDYSSAGGSGYSNQSYGSTGGYSTPVYSVTNPSYGSYAYSTPGTGYSSIPTYRPATGYSATPIYTPAPVNHSSNPAPIVYNTPVQQQQQQTAAAQPIIINNNNTNTNTNNNPNTNTLTNNNTAPIVQAAPQYTVAYIYPQTVAQTPVSCSNAITINGATTLSWTSSGANTAILSNGIGSVATQGSLIARPNSTVNYVLTVYGQGTTATCNVIVDVGGGYPQVSLTQIPYTGFDFGPVGDAIYWAALLSFAVASAYLLVYYRGGAVALATAMISGRSKGTIRPVNFTEAPAETVVPVEAPVIPIIEEKAPAAVNTRIASVAFNLPVAEPRRMTSDAMIVNHSKNGSAPRIVITRG